MDVGKLKAVRAGHKSAVTRLLRKTEEKTLDEEERSELLETLLPKQRIINGLNEEIFELLEEKDIEEKFYKQMNINFILTQKSDTYVKYTQLP